MPTSSKTRLFDAKHAVILCAVALLIAFAINSVSHSESLFAIARKGEPSLQQIWIGSLAGSLIALLGLGAFMVGLRHIKGFVVFQEQMFELFSRVDVSGFNPLVIGITAGLWEEVLFRAALQPLIGIWWGSMIFMLCHTSTGQFWAMNWKKAMYAVGVFAAGVLLGSIYERIGLLAAIATHAAIDIIGLFAVRHLHGLSLSASQSR